MPSPYLDGFLAAARPEARPTAPPVAAETPVASPDPPAAANLSFEEGIKSRLHPLDSFARLLECVSANRPPDAEDRFRFRWFGLFYHGPEQDAFTLRLRLPGGRLTPSQLAGLAEITQRHGSGQVILNPQGGLDIPGVPVTSADQALREVENIGLSARRTGGDCVQAVRGGERESPGREACHAPVYPLVCALEQVLAHGPVFADLPLPCEIVFFFDGEAANNRWLGGNILLLRSPVPGDADETRDTPFLLDLPGGSTGGWLLSTQQIVPACLSLLQAWAAGADRSTRENASLTRFLDTLDADALGTLLGGVRPSLQPSKTRQSPSTVPGGLPCGVVVPGKRLLSGQLAALAQCSREQAWQEVRLADGRLLATGADGDIIETAPGLVQVLSV